MSETLATDTKIEICNPEEPNPQQESIKNILSEERLHTILSHRAKVIENCAQEIVMKIVSDLEDSDDMTTDVLIDDPKLITKSARFIRLACARAYEILTTWLGEDTCSYDTNNVTGSTEFMITIPVDKVNELITERYCKG